MTVLVVAEHRRGALRDESHEAISAGLELADGECHVAVVGGDVGEFAGELNRDGIDVVHAVAAGEGYNHDEFVAGVATVAGEVEPDAILAPHTTIGLDTAPALATRLGRPLVTDALAVERTDDGLSVTRELYGSKVETELAVTGAPVLTLRPGEWPPAAGTGDATVTEHDLALDPGDRHTAVTGYEEAATGDVDITEADVLVSIGRGIGEEENLELIFDLAEALDATVSASRPIIDNGWLPPERQVGQSGKVVEPDVYIAIGISGAVQHVAGMKGAETIVAINDDASAPIFDLADYGIVDDLFDVVPALIEAAE